MRHKFFAAIFCAYLINFGGIIAYLLAGPAPLAKLPEKARPPLSLTQKPRYLYSIPAEPGGQLAEPLDVAVGEKGMIYVSDLGSHTVKVFDAAGKFLFSFSNPPGEPGRFVYPYGLAVKHNGNVLVSDSGTGAVYEFDATGKYVGTFLNPGPQLRPGMIEIDEKDNIYLSDLKNGLIKVYDPSGKFRFNIGGAQNQLNFPQGIVVDQERLWIADSGNSSIKISTLDNRPVHRVIGKENFVAVRGLAVDNLGRVLAADAMTGLIHVFDRAGNFLFSFGGLGQGPGKLVFPTGLAYQDNRLYIVERGNQRVQVWGY